MLLINSIHDILTSPIYTEVKFWLAAGGVLWSLSQISNRVMNWFKDVKEVVLKNIQHSVDKLGVDLKDQTETIVAGFDRHTTAVVSEMREQRSDLRMLYMQPLVAASPRSRRKPVKLVANSKPKKKPTKPAAK
jgi:hypothetical protein